MWSFYIKFPCGFTVCSSSDMANASSLAATRSKRGWFCTFNKFKRNMPVLNLIKSRWFCKRKHKSTREQTLTQNWRDPLSECRLFTLVSPRFLSLSLFTVFTSSISGVSFLLQCRAARGKNASSSFGFL